MKNKLLVSIISFISINAFAYNIDEYQKKIENQKFEINNFNTLQEAEKKLKEVNKMKYCASRQFDKAIKVMDESVDFFTKNMVDKEKLNLSKNESTLKNLNKIYTDYYNISGSLTECIGFKNTIPLKTNWKNDDIELLKNIVMCLNYQTNESIKYNNRINNILADIHKKMNDKREKDLEDYKKLVKFTYLSYQNNMADNMSYKQCLTTKN